MTDQLKSILNNFHDLLFIFNKDGVITDYINTNHEDELIFPKEFIIGKNHRDVLPSNVSDKLDQAFSELDQGREQYVFDYSLKLQEDEKWYTAIISKIKEGEEPEYLGSVRNITERKNQELLLQGILNTSPGGILVLQTVRNSNNQLIDFKIINLNKSVEILTGVLEKDLIGQNITAILDEDFKEEILSHFKKVLESGTPVESQYQHRDEQEQVTWYLSKSVKYRDGIIINFLDITKQKNTENNLAKKNHELKKLNQQKNKLFSVVSHDLRNSIAVTKGVCDIIIDEFEQLSKNEILEYLQVLNKRTNNTHELLVDLLDWSKNQFQKVTTNPGKLHLFNLTNEILDSVRSYSENKGIDLLNQIPHTIYVLADTNMLKTILRNLIYNGIKFSNPGGKIVISAEREIEMIKVSVIDEGVGMDEKTQKKVLSKQTNFTSKGTSGEKGSGVGLDLCIDFVEKNGGKIWVESEPGRGSKFNFTLTEYS